MADIANIQKALSEKRQEVGQRFASIPNIEAGIRSDLFGGDQTLKSLRGNETDKIKELYNHDKRMAETYANPESASYLADPYAREKALSMQSGATAGELSDIRGNISTRKDVLGDALEKALKLLNYGLEASKLEYSGLQDELDTAIKLQEIEERRKEKASGNLNKQKKEAEMAQAIAYLMTQTNSRDEAKQDIGAMAQRYPDSAAEILGLLDMFPEKQTTGISPEEWKLLGVDMGGSPESGASATTVKKVQLVDPRTRDIVEYDGVNDPDYFSDLQKGYMPL